MGVGSREQDGARERRAKSHPFSVDTPITIATVEL
jgi:hypothetical protein